MTCLCAKDLSLGYSQVPIVDSLNIEVKKGSISTIIGPNGSGKSTVLKSFAKLLCPMGGDCYLFDRSIRSMTNKELSKEIAMLLQRNTCPSDMTVKDLIYFGRFPHKKWYERKNENDDKIIEKIMEDIKISTMAHKKISELSGGESQRVWLAMALAQEPEVLLLDEPTTYLDISYQIELLKLIKDINRKFKTTIVMVLHDLNQAYKYSDYIYVLKNGSIYSFGKPDKVVDQKMLSDVYNVNAEIVEDSMGNRVIIPIEKRRQV